MKSSFDRRLLLLKKIFENFNEFINSQKAEPYEVCMFIYSLLVEKGYGYYPTGLFGEEYKLMDGRCDYGI